MIHLKIIINITNQKVGCLVLPAISASGGDGGFSVIGFKTTQIFINIHKNHQKK